MGKNRPDGSIPACAGEPELDNGGMLKVEGLSPRVRGNRTQVFVFSCYHRSIPACAGEPAASLRLLWKERVYPRVCGGTRR